ncbi:MAG: chromosomal replication initiator protein DnaA [Planctomycetia bacterium]|nr:chromosomal replication initiator protein DnaA [Planctomycetia bacterium]
MTTDDTEIVSALQVALADRVGSKRYEMWFGTNARIALVDDCLTVSVPSQFYQDWLRNNFRRDIENSCQATLGRDVPVTFEIDERLATPAPKGPPPDSPSTPPQPTDAPSRMLQTPGARRRFSALETFVIGSGNRVAAASAADVVERFGRYSPLVLHGPTGVGKTHLLEGIWTAAKRRDPRVHAIYLSAEQFTTSYVDAVRASGLPNFRNKYRGVELLLIDDLQFFAGKKATLGELLHTVDTLQREGRQLVFASDRAPANLAGLSPELVTRLSAGLVCRVDPPDYDTRLGVARRHCTRLDLTLSEDVLAFVATSFRDNARELIGALNKLHAFARTLARPVTLALAHEALGEAACATWRAVKLADVQRAVCEVFGLDAASLRSNRRTSAIAHPRMLAMWLARKHTRAALTEIGEFFGKRSHTTVISADKQVNRWVSDTRTIALANQNLAIGEAIRRVEERLVAS